MASVRDGYLAVFASARSDAGRAMALANIAALLAHRGDKVLVIDLAVDSPTLTRYFPEPTRRPASPATRQRPTPGVVELLAGLRDEVRRSRISAQAARETIERILETNEGAFRRVSLRYPNQPEDRTVEVHFLPVGGEGSPRERNRPLEGFEAFPGLMEEIAAALRARYDAVLIDAPTGETETTAMLTSHLADKLVLVVDDASLEEAIELGAWAHGRRAIASTDRPLFMFPLLLHVADGSAGRAFVDEAKPRLEALLRSSLALPSCDLSVYLELAQIPRRPVRTPPGRLAAEVEPTSDPHGITHAYFRFVQCLSKQSPIKVGARARPLSAELLNAIEARRSSSPDAVGRVPQDRQSSPDRGSIPPPASRSASQLASTQADSSRPSQRPEPVSSLHGRKLSAQHAERLAEAMALRSQGRNAEAAKICAAIVREAVRDERGSKETAKAFLALGDLSAQTETGEYDEVVRRFHERRHEDPEIFESVLLALYRRGKRHAARERFALATDSLSAALEIAGEWKFAGQSPSIDLRAIAADAGLVLALISIERGDDARAYTALRQAIEATTGGTSAAQRETEALALALEVLVLSRAGVPELAAENGALLRERLSALSSKPFAAISLLTAANEGAALGLAGRYAEAEALLTSLVAELSGAWQSPYFEIANAAAHNAAVVLARMGRVDDAVAMLRARFRSGGSMGASLSRIRFAEALAEGLVLAEAGKQAQAIVRLEELQETLRWTDVCLDHPGEAYMRERRADVAWYLTLTRERARGVDDLPGLLQASEDEGDARHGRVHLRAAFELARHGRRLDDLGAHRAAGACHEEAMARLERAGSRPPGDAAMLACAGLVALSRNATQRGIPLLRKAAEQGGTAALQWALERVRAEGMDVTALVAAVREAFDWVPRERVDALLAADPMGATLIRALVYPGRPPEPLLPPLSFPPPAARFALGVTPALSGKEPMAEDAGNAGSICRLLLLEPPDGTEDVLASFTAREPDRALSPRKAGVPLGPSASTIARLGPSIANLEEWLGAIDAIFPRQEPIAALLTWHALRPDGETLGPQRMALFVEPRDVLTFRLVLLNDVNGHDRLLYDGVTLIHLQDGQHAMALRRGTPLLALWRALTMGLGSAFSLSLGPKAKEGETVTLVGSPREPGTGIMRIELEVHRALVARRDPGALLSLVAEDLDGIKHSLEMEATIGRIEPSLFNNNV